MTIFKVDYFDTSRHVKLSYPLCQRAYIYIVISGPEGAPCRGYLRIDKGSWGGALYLDRWNQNSGDYDNTVYIF